MFEVEIARIKVLKADMVANEAAIEANRKTQSVLIVNRRTMKKEIDELIAVISA